jgi:hypothetical protein
MDTRDKELRFLKRYALAMTTLVGVLALAAFRGSMQQKQRFGEIDVERINIVEPDGKLRMVISNRPRSIGPIYKGQPFGYPGGGRPGVIFFNDEGSENGGMGFSGGRQPDGTYRASSQLAFDQFDQDQVLYLNYTDNNGQRVLGLHVMDRAPVNIFDLVQRRDSINRMTDTVARRAALQQLTAPVNGVPLAAQRVFVGRDRSRASVVNLSDPMGRPRLRLMVDSLGSARIEFLNEGGQVTRTIP